LISVVTNQTATLKPHNFSQMEAVSQPFHPSYVSKIKSLGESIPQDTITAVHYK